MKDHKYFIDTNIFLRLLTADQAKPFQECLKLFGEIKKEKIKVYTSTLVLAEVQWTLKSFYKFTKDETLISLYSILNLKHLKFLNNSNPVLGLELYKEHPVKFIDALVASLPDLETGKMAIISYDKDFDRLGVNRLTPDQL